MNIIKYLSLALLILFTSCNEQNSLDEGEAVKYSRVQAEDGMSMETLPFNDRDEDYELIKRNFITGEHLIDLTKANVTIYNWTHVKLYSFPLKDSNKTMAICELGNRTYSFFYEKTGESLVYRNRELQIIHDLRFNDGMITDVIDGGFNAGIKDSFPPEPSSICDCHGEDSECNHKYDRMENCHRFSYKECLSCGEDVCDQDIKCVQARSLSGPAWNFGLLMACLF